MIGPVRGLASRLRRGVLGVMPRVGRPSRGVLLGVAGVLAIGAVLSQRPAAASAADPASAAAQAAASRAHLGRARDALERLRDGIEAAIGEARRGAALTVQTGDLPGPRFAASGRLLAAVDPLLAEARAVLSDVAGDLAVAGIDGPPPTLELEPGRLASIGAEMTSTGAAADGFRRMHEATTTTLSGLAGALAALEDDRPGAALEAIAAAEDSLDAVREWPGQLATLPLWVDTTGKLLEAVRRLAIAVRDGDQAAARSAAAAYRAAAVDAQQADRALAIAIAEGGNVVSGTAMAAAAEALRQTEATLAAIQSLASILG